MDALVEELVLSILYYISPPDIVSFLTTCHRLLSLLEDRDKILPVFIHHIPNRNLLTLTIPHIINVYRCPYRVKPIVTSEWLIACLKKGRLFVTGYTNPYPPLRDVECDDVVDVIPLGDNLVVLGKNYITTLTTISGFDAIKGSTCYFYFNAIQVVTIPQSNDGTGILVLADDGVVTAMNLSIGHSYALAGMSPICYMLGNEERVELVGVDNKRWSLTIGTGEVSATPLEIGELAVKEYKKEDYPYVDMTGVIEICGDEDMLFLIMEDGTIDTVDTAELAGKRERLPFSLS